MPFATAGNSVYFEGIRLFFTLTPRKTHVIILEVVMLHFYTQYLLKRTVRVVEFPFFFEYKQGDYIASEIMVKVAQ